MASSLHCMLLLSTPANVNQHSLISDWLDTTGSISLKICSVRKIASDPHTKFTCMLQLTKN